MSMLPQTTRRQFGAAMMTIRALIMFDTATLLLFALLHLSGPLALDSIVLTEPRIIPAAVVEGLAGLIFAVSAYAVFARAHPGHGSRWSPRTASRWRASCLAS